MNNTCGQCGNPTVEGAKFCGNCGTLIDPTLEYSDPFKSQKLIWVFVYYGLILLICLVFNKIDIFENPLTNVYVVDALFIALTIYAAIANAEDLKPLFKVSDLQIIPLLVIILGTVVCSTLVNIIVPNINRTLFGQDSNFYYLFMQSSYPITAMFLSMALLPAVLEEIAFRGVIFNNLLSFTSRQNTLIVTTILFSVLHLSFISLFWLLPFALLLGWFRLKYNSIWYGIVAHFTFNAMTCIILLYRADVIK